ncbi:hypothetical protein TNCV_17521 [Trichonephila clavipes]|nr:hypothetical protein TNCV_17521 [Trichonephila clavipes]
MANADYDALKKPVSVSYFKPLPKATQCEKKNKKGEFTQVFLQAHPSKNVRTKGKAEQETLKEQRREAREAKKGMHYRGNGVEEFLTAWHTESHWYELIGSAHHSYKVVDP